MKCENFGAEPIRERQGGRARIWPLDQHARDLALVTLRVTTSLCVAASSILARRLLRELCFNRQRSKASRGDGIIGNQSVVAKSHNTKSYR